MIQLGETAKPVPLTTAQAVAVVIIVILLGKTILILPVEESLSIVIILKVYEVISLTIFDPLLTEAVKVLLKAVMVVVLTILG
jgi:hypothetical protein